MVQMLQVGKLVPCGFQNHPLVWHLDHPVLYLSLAIQVTPVATDSSADFIFILENMGSCGLVLLKKEFKNSFLLIGKAEIKALQAKPC